MRQNNLSYLSSPSSSSIYSASSPHIVESDKEILWLEVDCVLISVIQIYQDDTRWPAFQNSHLNTVLLSQNSLVSHPNIDACYKMRVVVSSEYIGI